MTKKIIAIGLSLATDDVEFGHFEDKTSLLDWDIVLFRPNIDAITSYDYGNTEYNGKLCLNDTKSFQLRESCAHWRREITQALEAGKTIIAFLNPIKDVYVATGTVSTSGTGRNQKVTRHVEPFNNYAAFPIKNNLTTAVGTAIAVHPNAQQILSSYWRVFGKKSQYNVVWNESHPATCLHTKHGQKPVGIVVNAKNSPGQLFVLPDLIFDDPAFTGHDEDGEEIWTDAAEQFAALLVAEVVSLSKAAAIGSERTPSPHWASDSEYALEIEFELKKQLLLAETELEKAEKEKARLVTELDDASQLRNLLFEKGKNLESAIILALRILGFSADSYYDGKSEFDAVFESPEGRLLGEAEGKDSKPINIDKLRQLSTNIHEDLQREEVSIPAKGILFGNAHRLTPPKDRPPEFTDKCISSAGSMSYGLISTSSLYSAAQYLANSKNERFARECRLAMIEQTGLVALPAIPFSPLELEISTGSSEQGAA